VIIAYDKAMHFIVGVVIYALLHFINPIVALIVVAVVGAVKEIFDGFGYGTPEAKDFFYTVLGGVTGFVCGL